MPGIIRSQRNASKRSPDVTRSSASLALFAVVTCPSLASRRSSARQTLGSSSTTRMRPLAVGAGIDEGAARTLATAEVDPTTALDAAGSSTRKTLPYPTSLFTVSVPPNEVTIPWQIASPSPVPTPTGLVVKNGSKIRPRTLSGMPAPLS